MRALPLLVIAGLASVHAAAAGAAQYGGCKFDSATGQFAGSTADQLRCLLKRVRVKGAGADVQPIPTWLQSNAGKPVSITSERVRAFLQQQSVENAVTAAVAVGDRPAVRYFVIHDTSSPEISAAAFPANMNEESYSANSLNGWASMTGRVNLITSRTGRSRLIVDWGAARSRPATKIEQTNMASAWRRAFVHVENIQPRLKPAHSWAWVAPQPGLTPAQEQRLALAYVVASFRAGRWLVPAYHFNIDQGLPDGHDDPQQMDLQSWTQRVSDLVTAIG
jgi:hypothetical protein